MCQQKGWKASTKYLERPLLWLDQQTVLWDLTWIEPQRQICCNLQASIHQKSNFKKLAYLKRPTLRMSITSPNQEAWKSCPWRYFQRIIQCQCQQLLNNPSHRIHYGHYWITSWSLYNMSKCNIRYKKSNVILNIHTDASYLGAPEAKNRTVGYFFFGWFPQDKKQIKLCGPLYTSSHPSDDLLLFLLLKQNLVLSF